MDLSSLNTQQIKIENQESMVSTEDIFAKTYLDIKRGKYYDPQGALASSFDKMRAKKARIKFKTNLPDIQN